MTEDDVMTDPMIDLAEDPDRAQETFRSHLLSIGVRKDALGEQSALVFVLLGSLAVRLVNSGLDHDACSQVLYGVWRGRDTIPEIEVIQDLDLRAQTRRMLDIALDETMAICEDGNRDNAVHVAWFVMSVAIDGAVRTRVLSQA